MSHAILRPGPASPLADQFAAFLTGFNAARPAPAPPAPRRAPQPEPVPAYTVEQYRAAMARHDWYYDRTEDPGVWRAGEASLARINRMARVVDPDFAIQRAYLAEREGEAK